MITILRWKLVLTGIVVLSFASVAHAGDKAKSLQVIVPTQCAFVHPIQSAEKCEILAIALAPADNAVWLEATVSKQWELNNRLGNASTIALYEFPFTVDQPAMKRTTWTRGVKGLMVVPKSTAVCVDGFRLKYRDEPTGGPFPLGVAWTVDGWQLREPGKVAPLTMAPLTAGKLLVSQVPWNPEGNLKLAPDTLQRTYQLQLDSAGKVQLHANYTVAVAGNLFQVDLDVPVALADPFTAALADVLRTGNKNMTYQQNQGMFAMQFRDKQYALVLALGKMERTALTNLLLRIQDRLNQLDVKSPSYALVYPTLQELAVAQRLAGLLKNEFTGKELQTYTDMLTNLGRLSDRLGDIVLPLAVTLQDSITKTSRDWIVYYNINKREGRALPKSLTWQDTKISTLEYAFLNRETVFLFRLQPAQPVALMNADLQLLKDKLAAMDKTLQGAAIDFGIPPNFQVGVPRLDAPFNTLKPGNSSLGANGELTVIMSIERTQADFFKEAILKKTGLAITLDWSANLFVFTKMQQQVRLDAQLRAANFAPILTPSQDKYKITVFVDPSIWVQLGSDNFVLQMDYQGQKTSIKMLKSAASHDVEFTMVKGDDGKEITRVRYVSPLTMQWLDPVEGPWVIIEARKK